MADSTPFIASDSAGFLTLHWDDNMAQETMVAKAVFVQMVDDINRLRTVIASIDALHQPLQDSEWLVIRCIQCDMEWPCSSRLALHPEEDNRA